MGEAAFLTAGFFAAGFLAAFLGDFLAFGLAAAFSPSLNDPLAPVDFPTFDRTPFSVPFLSAILRREFTGFWSLPSSLVEAKRKSVHCAVALVGPLFIGS